MSSFNSTSTGRDGSLWPVFLLLLAVLVPSGGVVWMMGQAMKNERLAVRQRLTDSYNSQMELAQHRINELWQERQAEIEEQVPEDLASAQFAKLVIEGGADSAIVWGTDGEVLYPDRLPRSQEANAHLRELELLEPESPEWIVVADKLRDRLNRYDSERLSAPQRLFLMRELTEQWPSVFEFATLAGESLAAEYLGAELLEQNDGLPLLTGLRPTSIEDVWSLNSKASNVTLLFRTTTLKRMVDSFVVDMPLPKGLVLQPLAQGEALETSTITPLTPMTPAMPSNQLSILTTDAQFVEDDSQRIALFAWTALAVIAATLILTWLVVRSWWRQMQVAKLKNDLVATVSHELKTPLSSIRLLVDTLLDEGPQTGSSLNGKAREYLELISHENARLTRLIDNFLTFSRMERGKRHVELKPIDAREVVGQAADAMRERFAADNCELTVEVNDPAPVHGDIDLLVTAVVNLLDNAWKYTGDKKRVHLSCKQQDGSVVISVQDNGAGLSPIATEKVFDRFYQVDQRLTRPQGGCGLGLSIVKYLVEAHGGEVAVESQSGIGSTFSISVPMDTTPVGQNRNAEARSSQR